MTIDFDQYSLAELTMQLGHSLAEGLSANQARELRLYLVDRQRGQDQHTLLICRVLQDLLSAYELSRHQEEERQSIATEIFNDTLKSDVFKFFRYGHIGHVTEILKDGYVAYEDGLRVADVIERLEELNLIQECGATYYMITPIGLSISKIIEGMVHGKSC